MPWISAGLYVVGEDQDLIMGSCQIAKALTNAALQLSSSWSLTNPATTYYTTHNHTPTMDTTPTSMAHLDQDSWQARLKRLCSGKEMKADLSEEVSLLATGC